MIDRLQAAVEALIADTQVCGSRRNAKRFAKRRAR